MSESGPVSCAGSGQARTSGRPGARAPGEAAVHVASAAAWSRHLGQPSSPTAVRRWLTAGTLPSAFSVTASRAPNLLAIEVDGLAATRGQLDRAAGELAAWLAGRSVGPGTRVLLCCPSSLGLIAAYLAVLRLGAAAVLASPALTSSELGHIVTDSQPAFGVAPPEQHARLTGLDGPAVPLPEPFQQPRPAAPASTLLGFQLPGNRGTGPPRPARAAPNSVAVLCYTSGTTGRPKGVPLTHANLLASIRGAMAAWAWRPDDVLVHGLPLYHQHGLGSIHATLLAGSRAVLRSHHDPEEIAAVIRSAGATVLFGVPTTHRLLVDSRPGRETFRALRLLVSGSAPLAPSLFAELAELTGQAPVERYGTTESGLDVSNPYPGPRKPGAVGLALPGAEVIVSGPGPSEAPPGADGEILVRGPQVFGGYWRRPDAEAFTPDGWFRTGDIGRRAPDDGFLAVVGRSKDLIITGGMNVYPREVELALEEHPAVLQAAVAGVSSRRWGEAVCGFVIPRPGTPPSTGELLSWCRGRLAGYKTPKLIVLRDALPVSAMGKVRRDVLSASVAGLDPDDTAGRSDGPRTG